MGILTDIAANTTYTETYPGDLAGGAFQLCPADTRRYSVEFSTTTAFTPIVTTHPDDPFAGGYTINPGVSKIFTVKDHGALAQAEWWCRASGVAAQMTVVQILIPKD